MKATPGGHRSRNRRQIAGISQTLALGLIGACGSVHAAYSCADLATVTTADSTVTASTPVAAGAVIGGSAVTVPMCRVQGTARPSFDSEIKFEVWLPPTAADWTGRMKVNGTGGYAGATPYARLAQDIGDGFVTAGSNMGHDGGESASWTLGHPEKVKDWGLRAHYFVATAAKTLSRAFYDKPVSHSYFEGCSNGGRQAMMMAQNYPELFDGIVAGAPSQWYPDLLMWLLWTGKTLTPDGGRSAVDFHRQARGDHAARAARPATPTTAWSTGRSPIRAPAHSTSTRWARPATARSPRTRSWSPSGCMAARIGTGTT